MILLAFSAALVGLIHSLAPGHWLPVVLTTKSRRWPIRTALLGALVAASGHILISIALGSAVIAIGAHFIVNYEESIEHWGGLLLVAFGISYGAYAYFNHHSCHGHTHHGPEPKKNGAPFLFLFSLGFSPCVAVVPLFIAAAGKGNLAVVISMIAFALGVIGALASATVLVSLGIMKLDHPWLEHYGDVITGLTVALIGAVLFLV